MSELLLDFWNTVSNKLVIVFTALFTFLSPISAFYHCIIVFLFLNFFAGLIDDLRNGKKFDFNKFKTFMYRIFFYITSITMIFLFEKVIISEFGITSKFMTAFATGMIAFYEIKSFLINASKATGNKIFLRIHEQICQYLKKRDIKIDDDNELDNNKYYKNKSPN